MSTSQTNLLFRLDGLVCVLECHIEKQGFFRRVTLDDADCLEEQKT